MGSKITGVIGTHKGNGIYIVFLDDNPTVPQEAFLSLALSKACKSPLPKNTVIEVEKTPRIGGRHQVMKIVK